MYNRTAYGAWWSATRSAATDANSLNTNTSLVYPQYSTGRGYGFALRCVARNGRGMTRLGASVPNYNRINEWPLQFLRTGYYLRSYGYLNDLTTYGHWWSNTASLATNGHALTASTGNVSPQSNYWRGTGFALRCGEGPQKYSLRGCTFEVF